MKSEYLKRIERAVTVAVYKALEAEVAKIEAEDPSLDMSLDLEEFVVVHFGHDEELSISITHKKL